MIREVLVHRITFVGANCIRPTMIQIISLFAEQWRFSFVLQAYSQVN